MSILSVQSHVTYGHVGNSAAVFILQSLGHRVWPVHTVQLSNHPGYPHVGGGVVPAEQLTAIFNGLRDNNWLDECAAVLGGYMGSLENADATLKAVGLVKHHQPEAFYICDPVIGDRPEGVYVPKEIIDFYRDQALPEADVFTPNLFELEILSGAAVSSVEDICAAARTLIKRGPQIVIVTSLLTQTPGGGLATLLVTDNQAWHVETPLYPCKAKGAGDVFAALWTGHWLNGNPPEAALARAVSGVCSLVKATADASVTGPVTQVSRSAELPVVGHINEALAPTPFYRPNLL